MPPWMTPEALDAYRAAMEESEQAKAAHPNPLPDYKNEICYPYTFTSLAVAQDAPFPETLVVKVVLDIDGTIFFMDTKGEPFHFKFLDRLKRTRGRYVRLRKANNVFVLSKFGSISLS